MPKFLLILALSVSLLTGCASTESNPLVSRIIVGQVVGRYIQAAPDWSAKAQRVVDTLKAAEDVASGESFTIAALREAAVSKIDWNSLTPADRDLTVAVIDAFVFEAEKYIGEGILSSEDTVAIRRLLQWARESAQVYLQ